MPTWYSYLIYIIYLLTGNVVAFFATAFILILILFRVLKRLFTKSRKVRPQPTTYTLAQIDAMDGYQFEKCMQDVYKRLGYSVHHTPLSGDQGADLIITSNERVRTAVQVKRYSKKVSNKAVQEVVAAKAIHRCTRGIVVTNNYFTASARQLANANDIDLVDRDGLRNLIQNISTYQVQQT
jgi:restriction system protein